MAEDQLDELERLVDTAGGLVVARTLQERRGPDPATYVGSGKVEEVAEAARALGAGWTVFDDELTPTQARNLDKKLPTQVLDRAGVILRIFAARARSREAMTQVELARLQYELPRLAGPSRGLAQQRGGGAFRGGAGERKIELDRRRVRTRIAKLKEELAHIETQRDVRRKGMKRVATVSLVGYTNAGKTTLFNRLTSSKEFAEDRLFATLDPRHARLQGVGGRAIVLADTVGFLRKLPHTLVASFKSTLAEVKDADLLVHVVDASSAQAAEQRAVAEEVIAGFGVEKRAHPPRVQQDRPPASRSARVGRDPDLGGDRRRGPRASGGDRREAGRPRRADAFLRIRECRRLRAGISSARARSGWRRRAFSFSRRFSPSRLSSRTARLSTRSSTSPPASSSSRRETCVSRRTILPSRGSGRRFPPPSFPSCCRTRPPRPSGPASSSRWVVSFSKRTPDFRS